MLPHGAGSDPAGTRAPDAVASGRNRLLDTGTTLGRILIFLGVSAVCGMLVAGLMVPAAAVAGIAANGSVQFFNGLPSELTVAPPGRWQEGPRGRWIPDRDAVQREPHPGSPRPNVPLHQGRDCRRQDSRFYEHGGIDPQGILRALASNFTKGTNEGASTLTQQYVTNVLNESRLAAGQTGQVVLSGQKTMGDKLREMKLAIELEKKFTKDQILEGYLNIVFFNRDAYGIEAAAQHFFSVSAKDLSLPQAALLAGLVNSPSYFDPSVHPDNSIERRNLVLADMLAQHKIQQADYAAAVATPLKLKVTPGKQGCAAADMAAYFCDYIPHLILNDPAYGASVTDREQNFCTAAA